MFTTTIPKDDHFYDLRSKRLNMVYELPVPPTWPVLRPGTIKRSV